MCYAIGNDYDDSMKCLGYDTFVIAATNAADALAPMHSMLPNLWARTWWKKK